MKFMQQISQILEFIHQLFALVEADPDERKTLSGELREQRRAIPQEFTDLHSVTGGSHEGVEAVQRGEPVKDRIADLLHTTDNMARANVPRNLSTQSRADAEKETVELILFEAFWRLTMGTLSWEQIDLKAYTYSALGVSLQAWLHGWLDAATEWAKAVRNYINDGEFSLAERNAFIQNIISVLRLIGKKLAFYADEPAVDAYVRPFYQEKLKGKLAVRYADLQDRMHDRQGWLGDFIQANKERQSKP